MIFAIFVTERLARFNEFFSTAFQRIARAHIRYLV